MSQLLHGNSKQITSQQTGVSDKLPSLTERYLSCAHQKPIAQRSRDSFLAMTEWLGDWDGEIVLDACCGVGESTARLAKAHPNAMVIGIDKSDARLGKHSHYTNDAANYRLFRADVHDMLLQMLAASWRFTAQYWWYPNPYPNKHQVQKRWHASPTMPLIMKLGGSIEVRSNWHIYLQEFAWVAQRYGKSANIQEITSDLSVTPFERKYRASGQPCWSLFVS